jgi:hypothetical protein
MGKGQIPDREEINRVYFSNLQGFDIALVFNLLLVISC